MARRWNAGTMAGLRRHFHCRTWDVGGGPLRSERTGTCPRTGTSPIPASCCTFACCAARATPCATWTWWCGATFVRRGHPKKQRRAAGRAEKRRAKPKRRPTTAPAEHMSAIRCNGTTKDGMPCQKMTCDPKGYCHLHEDQMKTIQCIGKTKTASRCSKMTCHVSGLCHIHRDQCCLPCAPSAKASDKASDKAPGKASTATATPPTTPPTSKGPPATPTAPRKPKTSQCAGLCNDGTRCQNRISHPSGRCHHHRA